MPPRVAIAVQTGYSADMAAVPDHIRSALARLNRDRTPRNWDERTRQGAPHKPLLLLSLMDGIEQGWISGPQISLSQDLVETFRVYWNGVMGEDRATTVALPFFHMQSEPFWELRYASQARPFTTSPSLGALQCRVLYGEMDRELFEVMADSTARTAVRQMLLDRYFSLEAAERLAGLIAFNCEAHEYVRALDSLAGEPFQADHTGEAVVRYQTSRTAVRDAGFSWKVRSAYDYTCAVCRSRLITPDGHTLVDGAHILPYRSHKNDDPRNGLSLCKNHHWMFDHRMLSVDAEYRIRVSSWVGREEYRVEATKEWDGEKILLPEDERLWPAREALEAV